MTTELQTKPTTKEDVESALKTIQEGAQVFANIITAVTNTCRAQSLALTKLEEAMMWAAKSLMP